MAAQFKVGDVVRLKSGSPQMTVTNTPAGTAFCRWFQDNKFQSETFSFDTLELVANERGNAQAATDYDPFK